MFSRGALPSCVRLIAASVLVASADALQANAEVGLSELSNATVHRADAPLMLVAEGCDGSTAILDHAAKILSFHGIDVGPREQMELLDNKRNPFIQQASNNIIEAMRLLKEQRNSQQRTLMFKSILHRDLGPTLSEGLVNLGTRAVYVSRSNMLDQIVCMIRDCFLNTDETTTIWGYPVNSNGEPSRMCFDRRTSEQSTKAYLKTTKPFGKFGTRSLLGEHLDFMNKQETSGLTLLKQHYDLERIAYEDLIAFEAGSDQVERSQYAWTALLRSWGVNARQQALNHYLARQAGTWKQESQADSIYNIEEVVGELTKLGRLDLLRE